MNTLMAVGLLLVRSVGCLARVTRVEASEDGASSIHDDDVLDFLYQPEDRYGQPLQLCCAATRQASHRHTPHTSHHTPHTAHHTPHRHTPHRTPTTAATRHTRHTATHHTATHHTATPHTSHHTPHTTHHTPHTSHHTPHTTHPTPHTTHIHHTQVRTAPAALLLPRGRRQRPPTMLGQTVSS
jgi:hypothetical protein